MTDDGAATGAPRHSGPEEAGAPEPATGERPAPPATGVEATPRRAAPRRAPAAKHPTEPGDTPATEPGAKPATKPATKTDTTAKKAARPRVQPATPAASSGPRTGAAPAQEAAAESAAAAECAPVAVGEGAFVPAGALVLPDAAFPQPGAEWAGRAVAAAAALTATDVLLLVGVLVTGLAASARQGPGPERLGAAFVGAVGTAHGLLLVVAAGLLAWSARSGGALAPRVAKVVVALAAMFFVASPLAAWGDVAYLHHARQAVDGVVRAQLATWMAVTMVPQGAAAMAAWWVVQQRA